MGEYGPGEGGGERESVCVCEWGVGSGRRDERLYADPDFAGSTLVCVPVDDVCGYRVNPVNIRLN